MVEVQILTRYPVVLKTQTIESPLHLNCCVTLVVFYLLKVFYLPIYHTLLRQPVAYPTNVRSFVIFFLSQQSTEMKVVFILQYD